MTYPINPPFFNIVRYTWGNTKGLSKVQVELVKGWLDMVSDPEIDQITVNDKAKELINKVFYPFITNKTRYKIIVNSETNDLSMAIFKWVFNNNARLIIKAAEQEVRFKHNVSDSSLKSICCIKAPLIIHTGLKNPIVWSIFLGISFVKIYLILKTMPKTIEFYTTRYIIPIVSDKNSESLIKISNSISFFVNSLKNYRFTLFSFWAITKFISKAHNYSLRMSNMITRIEYILWNMMIWSLSGGFQKDKKLGSVFVICETFSLCNQISRLYHEIANAFRYLADLQFHLQRESLQQETSNLWNKTMQTLLERKALSAKGFSHLVQGI